MNTYPQFAGFKKSGTSEQAAKEVTPSINESQKKIIWLLHNIGPMTADEIAVHLHKTVLYTRPRLSELVAKKLIFDTGRTRKNASNKSATVWEA